MVSQCCYFEKLSLFATVVHGTMLIGVTHHIEVISNNDTKDLVAITHHYWLLVHVYCMGDNIH